MKKLILVSLLVVSATASFAAQMEFVTLLSQPVGNFAKVELPASGKADIFHLNFCNSDVMLGSLNITSNFSAENLKASDATWGSNVSQYKLTKTGNNPPAVQVGKSGNMQVRNMQVDSLTFHVDSNPKKAYLKVDGVVKESGTSTTTTGVASFNTMEIPGIAKLTTPATGSVLRGSFVWKQIECGTSEECGELILVSHE